MFIPFQVCGIDATAITSVKMGWFVNSKTIIVPLGFPSSCRVKLNCVFVIMIMAMWRTFYMTFAVVVSFNAKFHLINKNLIYFSDIFKLIINIWLTFWYHSSLCWHRFFSQLIWAWGSISRRLLKPRLTNPNLMFTVMSLGDPSNVPQ